MPRYLGAEVDIFETFLFLTDELFGVHGGPKGDSGDTEGPTHRTHDHHERTVSLDFPPQLSPAERRVKVLADQDVESRGSIIS